MAKDPFISQCSDSDSDKESIPSSRKRRRSSTTTNQTSFSIPLPSFLRQPASWMITQGRTLAISLYRRTSTALNLDVTRLNRRQLLTLSSSAPPLPVSFREQRLFGYSAEQLFTVVSNVNDYHTFLPWCKTSRIISAGIKGSCSDEEGYQKVACDVMDYIPDRRVRKMGSGRAVKGDRESPPTKHYDVAWFKDRRVELRAQLGVGFGPLREEYTSTVTCDWPLSVEAQASDSTLFRRLHNLWEFTPAGSDPTDISHPSCFVNFYIDFEFKTAFYARVANMFTERITNDMIVAFEKKAYELYGEPSTRSELYGE